MYRGEVYFWVVSVDTVEKLAEIMAFIPDHEDVIDVPFYENWLF